MYRESRRKITFSIIFFVLMILAGCTENNPVQKQQQIEELVQQELDSTNSGLAVESGNATTMDSASETPTPIFTATPDIRMTPDQWQNWPIVPDVTNRSIQIYSNNDAIDRAAFSKIGDCQNIKEAFLGIYDKEGRYFLVESDQHLQETINYFSGYFDRDGKAIEQGLNVAAALSPLHADPQECLPAESPLACELRTVSPAFAFVSFERWWPDVTPPEEYKKYLSIVVEEIISNGTVPILITKADNIEGGHKINQIIAELSYEFDVPMYNWWKAAQFLPNNGMDMDAERNDGFHISFDAWDTRSYYALVTLDNLWKGLNNLNE